MILYTADWHIKLAQKNVPVEWAKNRYKALFDQIYTLEQGCEMHIIGGDLFDRLPSMDELALYFSFIRNVSIPTLIYDGNHEATKKNTTFFTQLKEVSQAVNPLIHIIDSSFVDKDFGFSILPYCDLHKKGAIEALDTSMPLFTHVRGEIPPHVKPEVDLERFSEFPIVFAGDLHAHSNSQLNIVYPGSPVTTSFHRSEVSTGFLLINNSDWSWGWGNFELPQLIRKTIKLESEMVPTEYNHTIYEIEGGLHDLSTIKHTDLLDKKIVKRTVDTSLVLGTDMTIEEELAEYLLYILELSEKDVPEVMKTFNDYTTHFKMG